VHKKTAQPIFSRTCDPVLRVPGAAVLTASQRLMIWHQILHVRLSAGPDKPVTAQSFFKMTNCARKPVNNMLAWLMVFVISLSDSASNTPPTGNYSFNSYECFISSTSVVKWQSSSHFSSSSSPTLCSFHLSKSFSGLQHFSLSAKACSRWPFLRFFGPFCSYYCLQLQVPLENNLFSRNAWTR